MQTCSRNYELFLDPVSKFELHCIHFTLKMMSDGLSIFACLTLISYDSGRMHTRIRGEPEGNDLYKAAEVSDHQESSSG